MLVLINIKNIDFYSFIKDHFKKIELGLIIKTEQIELMIQKKVISKTGILKI